MTSVFVGHWLDNSPLLNILGCILSAVGASKFFSSLYNIFIYIYIYITSVHHRSMVRTIDSCDKGNTYSSFWGQQAVQCSKRAISHMKVSFCNFMNKKASKKTIISL